MIQGKLLYSSDDLSEVFRIRKIVFVDEQGISEELERDDKDDQAIHAIVYCTEDSRIPVATGRIVYDGEVCKIGRIAVLKEYRNQGYGDFVVRLLVNKALTAGISSVVLHAQYHTVDFYKKIGFITEGESFYEAGVKHIKMKMNPELLCGKCCHTR